MKFGKDFRNHLEETLPDWRDKFLPYKPLKKIIKHLPPDEPAAASAAAAVPAVDGFTRILEDELEKLDDFYVDKEEEFVIRFQELKERIDKIRRKKTEPSTSESEFSEETMEILRAFVKIHGEMVLLKNYSSLNFAALVKILKKYDKRTGALLSLPFTQRALQQPFFTTEPLTQLVHECEANLELLFPLEAEVVQTNQPEKPEPETDINDHLTSSGQEGTMEVYRSTLAAMKALQDLRKASSTYNPLSIAQFFHRRDEDLGVVISENSISNSASDCKGGDQESAPSQS